MVGEKSKKIDEPASAVFKELLVDQGETTKTSSETRTPPKERLNEKFSWPCPQLDSVENSKDITGKFDVKEVVLKGLTYLSWI